LLRKGTRPWRPLCTDLERELREVHEATAAEKKRLEDELAEERCKAVETTAQFNAVATGEF
jgi:hypothetical protein